MRGEPRPTMPVKRPDPITIGFLDIEQAKQPAAEAYIRIIGAVSAAQRLGCRVDVRVIHRDADGTLSFLEFVATPARPTGGTS
jgi:hypothetical protein